MDEKSYSEDVETSKAQNLNAAMIREISDILNDPKSFSDNPKPCVPRPGVKVRYTRADANPIWIFICFDCEEMVVYESGTHREHKVIDPGTKALAAVMKRIFPNSPEMQRLK